MPSKMLAQNNGITIAQYAMVAEHLAWIVRNSVICHPVSCFAQGL
jgi:hypothetical protein